MIYGWKSDCLKKNTGILELPDPRLGRILDPKTKETVVSYYSDVGFDHIHMCPEKMIA